MKRTFYLVLLASVAGWLTPLAGQSTLQRGRSCIELSFGLWMRGSSTAQITAGEVTASANGPSGALSYFYGLRDQLFLGVSGSVAGTKATTSASLLGSAQVFSAAFPLQIGVRYWIFQPEDEDVSMVPFIQGTVGPVFGFEASNAILVQEARTETAMGGRISAGVSLFTSRSFMVGLQVGYLLMTDYDRTVGGRRNFNGPDFSLGIAFLWGSGRTSTQGG